MQNTVFNVGVIGCGVICQNHLSPLSQMPNIHIAAVCDIIPERASRMAAQYHCKAYTDYKQMFEQEKLDAVHICLPHYLHCPVSVAAMQKGIDVLCEKPMNADLFGAEKMAETAEKTGRKLGIIFQNRYNTGSVLAKETITSGKIGKLTGITGTVMWHRDEAYYNNGTWRKDYKTAGGGVIINQAIHTLDLIRWLDGSDVAEVKATVSHHGSTTAEVEDTSEGVITFASGVRGLFYFSINNAFDDSISVTASCEGGTIRITGSRCVITTPNGETIEDIPNGETFCGAKAVYGTGHAFQIAKFYEPGSEAEVKSTMLEALKTQRLIHEIFKSAKIIM